MSGGYYHRNQYWTNRNTKKSSNNNNNMSLDYVKVIALVLIYCGLFFSAGQKYFTPSSTVNFSLKPTYQYCELVCKNEKKEVLEECKKQEDAAYADDIAERCKPYITSLNACLKATKDMKKCSTEGSNLEGCTGKIVKAVVDKWWADYNLKQPENDKGTTDSSGGKDKSNSNLKKSTSITLIT